MSSSVGKLPTSRSVRSNRNAVARREPGSETNRRCRPRAPAVRHSFRSGAKEDAGIQAGKCSSVNRTIFAGASSPLTSEKETDSHGTARSDVHAPAWKACRRNGLRHVGKADIDTRAGHRRDRPGEGSAPGNCRGLCEDASVLCRQTGRKPQEASVRSLLSGTALARNSRAGSPVASTFSGHWGRIEGRAT